jgi:GDP-L-fucose synthase
MNKTDKVLITGGTGLIGMALTRELSESGYKSVISLGSSDCDLRQLDSVLASFDHLKPDYVFHLAARVHGLGGNLKYKSDVLVDNARMNINVIEASRLFGVKKIVAMGSGCVYPDLGTQQELNEGQIWSGPPHPSEDSYAHSKRLMMAQLEAARQQYGLSSAFVISGNLYGPHDNFNQEDGHVIPSLIAKFFSAMKTGSNVSAWGTGVAVRDFTHSTDMARALILIMDHFEGSLNAGSGYRHSIGEIVGTLEKLTGVGVEWDTSKPDGQLMRYYNLERLKEIGFEPRVPLELGLKETYNWYSSNFPSIRT